MKYYFLLCVLVLCEATRSEELRRFPDEFIFGTATAAYQVEGGWNADDKGESIWDHWVHTNPEVVKDRSNGDVVADSYHNYKRDVEMMRELGVDVYRFSLAWTRILPDGFSNRVSQAGVNFYNNYINEMLKYNITPTATLYHWDLPQKLQDLGGWANPLVADWFADYARVAFKNFGDRIKMWSTINEPREICYEGYGDNTKAPAINLKGIAEYLCSKHLLMAHAKAWHVYDKEFRESQGGKCGIVINEDYLEAASDSKEDLEAVELVRQAEAAQYAYPIFSKEGGYPMELKKRIAAKSAAQGYPRSRLPEMSKDEIDLIRGTSDFYGINHYTAFYVYSNSSTRGIYPVPSYWDDLDSNIYALDNWTQSASSFLREVPWSLYKAIMYVTERYNPSEIYITENGWSTHRGLNDDSRINYIRAQLNGVLDALQEGAKVKGYMAWSLMDNIEWQQGIEERFGLYEVDFEDPGRRRTARKSALVYKEIIRSRVVDPNYEPDGFQDDQ